MATSVYLPVSVKLRLSNRWVMSVCTPSLPPHLSNGYPSAPSSLGLPNCLIQARAGVPAESGACKSYSSNLWSTQRRGWAGPELFAVYRVACTRKAAQKQARIPLWLAGTVNSRSGVWSFVLPGRLPGFLWATLSRTVVVVALLELLLLLVCSYPVTYGVCPPPPVSRPFRCVCVPKKPNSSLSFLTLAVHCCGHMPGKTHCGHKTNRAEREREREKRELVLNTEDTCSKRTANAVVCVCWRAAISLVEHKWMVTTLPRKRKKETNRWYKIGALLSRALIRPPAMVKFTTYCNQLTTTYLPWACSSFSF